MQHWHWLHRGATLIQQLWRGRSKTKAEQRPLCVNSICTLCAYVHTHTHLHSPAIVIILNVCARWRCARLCCCLACMPSAFLVEGACMHVVMFAAYQMRSTTHSEGYFFSEAFFNSRSFDDSSQLSSTQGPELPQTLQP